MVQLTMNIMKKFLPVFLFLLFTTLAGTGEAATVVNTSQVSARVSLSQEAFRGVVYLDATPFQYKNSTDTTDDVQTSSISWETNSSYVGGQKAWVVSPVYLKLESVILDQSGSVQIYTDNAHLTTEVNPADRSSLDIAEYRKNYGAQAVVSGLYGTWKDGGQIKSGGSPNLPMAWRVVSVATNSFSVQEGAVVGGQSFPDRLWSSELGPTFPCWIRMEDVSNVHIGGQAASLGDISKIRDASLGIQIAEATFSRTAFSTHFIYFAVNFRATLAETHYKATIIVDAFTE